MTTQGTATQPPLTSGEGADMALGLLAKGGDDLAAVVFELDAIRLELRTANLIALLQTPAMAESRYNHLVSQILQGMNLA